MENELKQFISKRNFILQQGFDDPPKEMSTAQFSALQFQPRIVGSLVLIGVIFQSPSLFLVLSAVLWWSALLPQWNPFDILHNHTLGARPGAVHLKPAPEPRRFAQGMAGTFSLIIGALLLAQWNLAAFLFEAFFLAAVAALLFGHFCFGSFVFHLLHGRASFAKRTLPWVQNATCAENSCSWR
jgi:Domain of unknown function (DUF4395)